jgi:regulator of nonsense transcripts 3
MRKDDIMPLSEVVRGATWEDAKATFTNPALIGPAALEFSIYKKVPSTKKRTDARQGTIDQDPEFMAFLEGLANPVPMRESIDVQDAEDSGKVENKVTTTPLVEFLKEKKANKNKEGSGKNSKSGKGKGGSKDDEASGRRKGKESRGDKQDKAPKETVKILTKKAAAEQAAEGAKKAAGQINAAANASTATTATTAGDAPKSRRAGIAAAARILQRDLGLSPGSAHRRARHDAAKAESDAKAAPSSNQDKETKGTATDSNATTPTSTASVETTAQAPKTRAEGQPASKSQSGRRTRGGKGAAEKAKVATIDTPATQQAPSNPPVILKKKQDAETGQKAAEPQPAAPATNSNGNGKQTPKEKANSNKQASQKKSANISANATRAFVKNVNASQGVNDASLREALGAFGTITFVEIDKRKGFAYVDFSENEALVKAAGASPLQVGQATVQVLERKDKKPAANAAPTTSGKDGNTANGDKEKEKSTSSRGRRGRGGGKAVAGAAASTANSQPTAAAASTGG